MLRLFSAASNSVSPKPKTRRHLAFEQVEARALLAANIASSEFYEAGLIGPPLIEPLPPEALGKPIIIEFNFLSDSANTLPHSGWYLDDIKVLGQ